MGPFAAALIQQGAQTAANTANTAMGIAAGRVMEKHNDTRQINQQQKLQNMQIQGEKEMADYNLQNQLKMWQNTGYEAQRKQMEEAGINPALMYGMGGGGGQTASVAPGNVSGADAPKGGGESLAMVGMGLQMQLLKAQKDVLETQAEKNRAEATSVAGVQTEEAKTRIDSLLQGIDNQRMDYETKRLTITMQNIENYEKQASQEDRLDYIEYQAKTAAKILQSATAQGKIDETTANDKITIIRQQAIESMLKNELTRAGIENTQVDTALKSTEIKKAINDISVANTEVAIKQFTAQIQANFPSVMNTIGKIINDGIETLFQATGAGKREYYKPDIKK
jgi:hypothetical protein